MDDQVGEVLAQRTALESGAAAGIAVSVFLHVLVTAAAVYAALRQPPPQTVPTIEIRFAQARPAAVKAPSAPAVQPQPQPPIPLPKPAEKTVPLSSFGKSTKKGSETPTPPKPAIRQPGNPAAQPPASAPGQAEATVPMATTIEGDFPYTIYIDRMKNLIGTHWYRPQVTAGATTTIRFVIDRDGGIRDATVEAESGNGTFDRAALRAVLESSPLPPLPFGYAGTYLGVHLTFR
jgi:TonB family protein